MDLRDPDFDTQEPEKREDYLLERLRQQVDHAMRSSLFWRERFEQIALSPSSIRSCADWRRFPPLQKSELRDLGPWGLVPEEARSRIVMARSTSGTTGKPTISMWTPQDWRALSYSVSRMLAPFKPSHELRALNGYHQSHLTGPLYDSAIQCLGGVSLPRSHVEEANWPTTAQLKDLDSNTLILAEGPGSAKTGITMRDILETDAPALQALDVGWWIGSSGTFTLATIEQVRDLGITTVTNLYGSSEFGLFAVSCPKISGHFHIGEGHVFVEVIGEDGRETKDGERGRLVVTNLGAVMDDGEFAPHQGTQLFRLDIGNEARLHKERCGCGLTTRRLSDIKRV